jgi:hypothetical protein
MKLKKFNVVKVTNGKAGIACLKGLGFAGCGKGPADNGGKQPKGTNKAGDTGQQTKPAPEGPS